MHSSTIFALFTAVLAPVAVLAAPEPHHKPHWPHHYPSGTGTGYPLPTGTGYPTGTGAPYPTATTFYRRQRKA
ncbi:hypothetical protein ACLMJK_001273 [Lecanora helva]